MQGLGGLGLDFRIGSNAELNNNSPYGPRDCHDRYPSPVDPRKAPAAPSFEKPARIVAARGCDALGGCWLFYCDCSGI